MMSRYFAIAVTAVSLACLTSLQAQNTVMVGSTELTVRDVVTGVDIPWEIVWGPDDHIWFTERVGRISRVDPETGDRDILLDLTSTVHQQAESGMLGLALHPNFESTPHLFVAYNYSVAGSGIRERIVRYEYDGDALVNPLTLVEDIPGSATHNGCRLIILPDNTLLATTGDAAQPQTLPQSLGSLAGKVLRMNLDGSIPSDNPFGDDSYIYAYGLRNSQGLTLAPNGKLYSSEHGPDTNDEFNIIEPGINYGWPLVNGFCTLPAEQEHCNSWDNYSDPLTVWYENSTIAPSDLIYYDHPAIPEWQGRFLMTVLKNKHVRAIKVDDDEGTDILEDVEYLTDEFGRLRDICTSPDGRVFLATNGAFWSNTQPNTHKIVELKNEDYDPVGLAEQQPQALKVFPNPTSHSLNLELSEAWVGSIARVSDMLGRELLSLQVQHTSSVMDVSRLPEGFYTIDLIGRDRASSQRFIISR